MFRSTVTPCACTTVSVVRRVSSQTGRVRTASHYRLPARIGAARPRPASSAVRLSEHGLLEDQWVTAFGSLVSVTSSSCSATAGCPGCAPLPSSLCRLLCQAEHLLRRPSSTERGRRSRLTYALRATVGLHARTTLVLSRSTAPVRHRRPRGLRQRTPRRLRPRRDTLKLPSRYLKGTLSVFCG